MPQGDLAKGVLSSQKINQQQKKILKSVKKWQKGNRENQMLKFRVCLQTMIHPLQRQKEVETKYLKKRQATQTTRADDNDDS